MTNPYASEERARYDPDPLFVDEDPRYPVGWSEGAPAHVTPVGCWLLAAAVIAALVFAAWRMTR